MEQSFNIHTRAHVARHIGEASGLSVSHQAALIARTHSAAADLFALLASPMRLKIVYRLRDGECSLAQLLDRMESSPAALLPHLAALCEAGAVVRRFCKGKSYYSLYDSPSLRLCCAVLDD